MSDQPKFSILLPTRNRSHLAQHAIRSVLGQSEKDFELVISDNSSNDETAKVVKGFSDHRIRYFRTDHVLGMPDNFENAFSHSAGEWITLLPDDCVLSSRCLATIEDALAICPSKLVVWDWWHYYPSSAPEPLRRNQYVRRPFDGLVRFEDSRSTLRDLYALRHGKTLPKPYQSCAHRSLFEVLRNRLGRVFQPPAPDYTFLTGVLAFTDRFTFVDLPMMLSNAGDTTPHASPEAFRRFLDELGEAGKGGWMPIKIPLVHPGTILVESICRIQKELPELREFELDLERYLVDFRHQLAIYAEQQYPIEFERAQYETFFAKQSVRTRLRVSLAYTRFRARLLARKQAKRVVLRVPILGRLLEFSSGSAIVRGVDEGFFDIKEAMRHLEKSFAPRLLPRA